MGQNRFGFYKDDCDGIHPKTIEAYYGVDRKENAAHDTEDPTIEDLASKIQGGQNPQIRHEGVDVAQACSPFPSEEVEQQFFDVLGKVIQAKVIPAGFNLLPEEWVDDQYPGSETLKIGVRLRKEIEIELRESLWYERAVLWGQALNVLQKFAESNML